MGENENSDSKATDGPQRFGEAKHQSSGEAKHHGSGEEADGEMADGAMPNVKSSDADVVASAKAEVDKWKNEYLYLRAEFENYKKQVIKERSDLRKYGSERLVSDLLGVLDIFETALTTDASAENSANFRKGIEMTASEMRNVLSRHGVTEIASQGLPFDPSHHEALSSEESAEVAPGSITRVFKKPYRLHDRVVRPGQVIVAKAKS